MAKATEETKKTAAETTDGKKCKRCGSVVGEKDTVCPECLAPTEWKA